VQLGEASGGKATAVSGIGLVVFLVILTGLGGGWVWYGTTNSSGIPSWALLEIGVLGAALSTAALLALTVGAVKGLAIVIGWLAGRIFWLILIVGGIFVAERAVVAYFQGHWDDSPIISDCQLCSSIHRSVVSAIPNTRVFLGGPGGPESSTSVSTDGLICLDGRSGISARNHISGRVSTIQSEAGMSVVTVKANGPEQLISALTSQAVRELRLKENDSVVAFVKATEIGVVKGDGFDTAMLGFGVRNRLGGHVVDIQKGNAMDCLTIVVGNWKLTSAMTQQALDELHLKTGEPITAIFKATDVQLQKT